MSVTQSDRFGLEFWKVHIMQFASSDTSCILQEHLDETDQRKMSRWDGYGRLWYSSNNHTLQKLGAEKLFTNTSAQGTWATTTDHHNGVHCCQL